MNSENWDDLRFVLAVAELGSVLQAAHKLGVTHATVLRRVSAFEERHGAKVFDRTPQGYQLAADQRHVLDAARTAEAAMVEVSRLTSGGAKPVQDVVRVTTTDSFAVHVMPGFLAQAADDLGRTDVFVQSSNAHVDLLKSGAHIAVRPAMSLPDDLVGDHVANLHFAAYVAKAERDRRWLRLSGPLARTDVARTMGEVVSPEDFGPGADSFLSLIEMVAQGCGRGILPSYLGDADPRLRRANCPVALRPVPVWIARHLEASVSSSKRRVMQRLADYIRNDADGLLEPV